MRLLAVAEMEAVEVWRYPAGVAKGLGLALDRAYCAMKISAGARSRPIGV
jgi:hypothetical protein